MNEGMVELRTLLRYQLQTNSGTHEQMSDYRLDVRATIVGEPVSEHLPDYNEVITLGSMEFSLVRVTLAHEDDACLFTLFDDTQPLMDLASALFEPGFVEYVESVSERFSAAFGHEDILHFHWIEVFPFARGQRVGASALYRAARDWNGGCGLVAIKPDPPQCDENARDCHDWDGLAFDSFPADRTMAGRRLARHFGELGFESVGNLPYLLSSPNHCGIPVQELDIRESVFFAPAVLDALRLP